MRKYAIWLLVLLALGSISVVVVSNDMLYPVEILLTTTSDWTQVQFTGCSLAVQSYAILEGADTPGLQTGAGATLSIVKNAYDQTQVTIRVTAYVANPAQTWIRISIAKGHVGDTTLSLTDDEGQVLASFTHSGIAANASPDNIRDFTLRTSQISSSVSVKILETPSETSLGGQKVLAFYYPWYGTPEGASGQWVHWDPSRSDYAATHMPTSGYYDSLDAETLRRHIQEAKAADIDGFIASWWEIGSFEDRAFDLLLQVAEEENFLIAPYYEDALSSLQLVTGINFIVSRYGDSPSFLKVDGLPVIFFYVRVLNRFSLAQWESAFASVRQGNHEIFAIADSLQPDYLSAFQGLHTYNPVGLPLAAVTSQYSAASLAARLQGKLFAATVLPGYQEAVFRASSPVAQRADGETYHSYWNIARESQPHWILITSFNEWHEGSEIEPSEEFGTTYLTQTAHEAEIWRSGETAGAEDAEGDRDGDGVRDDADYCPDWPGSEATDGC